MRYYTLKDEVTFDLTKVLLATKKKEGRVIRVYFDTFNESCPFTDVEFETKEQCDQYYKDLKRGLYSKI